MVGRVDTVYLLQLESVKPITAEVGIDYYSYIR